MFERVFNLLLRRKARYDAAFFDAAWFNNWEKLSGILHQLITLIPDWRTILDFGCGPGAMIDLMNTAGYRYVGYDNSDEARRLYLAHFGDYPDRYIQSIDGADLDSVDLFLSFDVFEHMRDVDIDGVLRQTAAIPELLLNISRNRSTPGHINIKKDKQWIRFFEKRGVVIDSERTNFLRQAYSEIRPECPDVWNRNMFVLKREIHSLKATIDE